MLIEFKNICLITGKKVLAEFVRLLRESLSNNEGQYSVRKIIICLSFNTAFFQAMVDQFTSFKLNEKVFMAFLTVATGQSVMNFFGKKASNLLKIKSPTPVKDNVDSTVNKIEIEKKI